MAKLFYLDLETTGTLYWKHGIHQISGQIVIDAIFKESFNFKVRPNEKALIEDESLKIAGVTREMLALYPNMDFVYKQLVHILANYVDKFNQKDKFHIVGYNNASFDNHFLRAFFKQNNDEYFGSWFWSDSIDVMVLASHKLMNERHKMENFKLMTVAKYLEIPIDESKLHDAEYDIEVTRQIHLKVK